MQQIYRRKPMPKCDFNNVAGNLLISNSEAARKLRKPYFLFSEDSSK